MAFAAVISLKSTIERIVNSSEILLTPPTQEIIEFASKKLQSLQQILEKLDNSSMKITRNRVNALDAKIRVLVSRFEDLLESHIADQISSQSEETHPLKFSIDLRHLRQNVDSFVDAAGKMEEEYINELDNPLLEEADAAAGFGESKSKMVGLSNLLGQIKDQFTRPRYAGLPVFSLFGMAGIGKTTLAREIFDDPLILSHFECLAWVRVGRKCRLSEIPRSILAQIDETFKGGDDDDDEKMKECLYEFLENRRYLIVLDDVWETEIWECVRNCFPNSDDGRSRILITTRLREVADHTTISSYSNIKAVPLLNDEESWDLFRGKVFGEEWCPPKLEEAGRKIVKHCEGLPLTIIKVADRLSDVEITVEYWNEVASDRENYVFMAVYDEIAEVLFPSYEYLPQRLKPCFLYMGAFPRDYEVSRSEVVDMWVAEGFLVPNSEQSLEDCATKSLVELVSHSLVLILEKSTVLRRRIKTCRLHSSLWHLSKMEVRKNKFFHILNSLARDFEGHLQGQRKLCIHNNVLLGIKDGHDAMEDDCGSTARSLLCLGPYHRYPLPLCFGLRFLRVLRALSIRLYEFPTEVVELVHLRYLALTCNGDVPPSVSNLFNLQFLIIYRCLSIKSDASPMFVPKEIWDMHELKHVQIMGSDLPEPNPDAFLRNLEKLVDVSVESCTKGVLTKISNLKKLGIQIMLVPDDDDGNPFHCLNEVSCLHKLESLKCVVVNPELISEVVAPPPPVSMFPSSLLKLHLSGLCYPWEYTEVIGSLPNLQVLKLQRYAFCGPKWEVKGFKRLVYLVIDDADLVEWNVESGGFARLRHLSLKHCYNLEVFHWNFDYYFKEVEVVDSNPLAETFVNRIKDRRGRRFLDVSFHHSWDDGRPKK